MPFKNCPEPTRRGWVFNVSGSGPGVRLLKPCSNVPMRVTAQNCWQYLPSLASYIIHQPRSHRHVSMQSELSPGVATHLRMVVAPVIRTGRTPFAFVVTSAACFMQLSLQLRNCLTHMGLQHVPSLEMMSSRGGGPPDSASQPSVAILPADRPALQRAHRQVCSAHRRQLWRRCPTHRYHWQPRFCLAWHPMATSTDLGWGTPGANRPDATTWRRRRLPPRTV